VIIMGLGIFLVSHILRTYEKVLRRGKNQTWNLTDLQVLSTPECQNTAFPRLSLCMHECDLHYCLNRWTGFIHIWYLRVYLL
jgi:hypothetical protein